MKEYIYPAIFHQNDDGSVTVMFPDLPGCITEGKSMGTAMNMAQSALTQWIEYLKDEKEAIPAATACASISVEDNELVSLVQADMKDSRAVKRTVSLPKWMDDKLAEAGFSLSKLLQEAGKKKLELIQA